MNSEVKQQWLKALRSGGWRKARNQLAGKANRRCCLGVLCEIGPSKRVDSLTRLYDSNAWHANDGSPNRVTQQWAGIDMNTVRDLSILNDKTKGWDKVIEYIEKKL